MLNEGFVDIVDTSNEGEGEIGDWEIKGVNREAINYIEGRIEEHWRAAIERRAKRKRYTFSLSYLDH